MFENLTNKFEEIFSSLKKAPSLNEKQVDEGLRNIRQALLEADVSLKVAKEFIDNVRQTNIRIIFLSNRMAKNELPTIENMKALNVYESDDIFLLRIDKPDKKHVRRAEVLEGTGRMEEVGPMNVLAYFGDARHDFPDPSNDYIFGQNMFMLPNPMYGKW